MATEIWRDFRTNKIVAKVDGVEFDVPGALLQCMDRRYLYGVPPKTPYRIFEPPFWYAYARAQMMRGEISMREYEQSQRLLEVANLMEEIRAQSAA